MISDYFEIESWRYSITNQSVFDKNWTLYFFNRFMTGVLANKLKLEYKFDL